MKFNKSILAVATLSLMLSACATTPEDPNAKAKKGALIGAASGAAAGYLIGRNTAGALIGAAVGTAAGAGIGPYANNCRAPAWMWFAKAITSCLICQVVLLLGSIALM